MNGIPDDVICNIAFYTDDATLCSKCEYCYLFWWYYTLHANVIRHLICAVATTRIAASELESDLWDTGLGHEEACWFQCWKNSNSFCFTCLMTLVLLMWKWMGLFLRKNHPFRCYGWLSLPNWIEAHTLPLLLKLFPRKLEL